MSATLRQHRGALGALAALIVMTGQASGAAMYHVTSLPGDFLSLNNEGQVAGTTATANNQGGYASRYNSYGPLAGQIENVGGTFSTGSGINDSGTVVGQKDASGTPVALPGSWGGTGAVINNAGQVALPGYWTLPWGQLPQLQIVQGGNATVLPTLPNARLSVPEAINNSGQIAGYTEVMPTNPEQFGMSHATVWSPSGARDLGTLGGVGSSAFDINDAGTVVGGSILPSGDSHAIVYQDGQMRDLGTLGGNRSTAWAINNKGDIVGVSAILNGSANHAFLYHDGKMIDLNTMIPKELGVTLNLAKDINDLGQILVWSYDAKGLSHDYLLTPGDQPAPADVIPPPPVVPEPTSLAGWCLLTLAAAGFAYRRSVS
jgi:probable HAF family extracellular repeat protein